MLRVLNCPGRARTVAGKIALGGRVALPSGSLLVHHRDYNSDEVLNQVRTHLTGLAARGGCARMASSGDRASPTACRGACTCHYWPI
jgi:hypothetical protein